MNVGWASIVELLIQFTFKCIALSNMLNCLKIFNYQCKIDTNPNVLPVSNINEFVKKVLILSITTNFLHYGTFEYAGQMKGKTHYCYVCKSQMN